MSTATTPTPTLRARVRGLTRFYLTVPLLILTVLLIANGIFGRGLTLLDSTHIAGTLAASAPYVLSGMACVMPVLGGGGGLDMAIGPVLGFTTVLIAAVLVPGGIESPFLLVPLVLGFGLASGALSGWLGNYVRIPPVIATLGLYMAFAGLAPFVMPIPGGLVPDWLVGLTGMVGPVPGILFVYVAIGVMWWVLRRIGYVRNLLNVGGDERAAYTSGVEVQAVRMFAYMLGGMFCAIGGMLLAGTIHSGDATVGPIFTVVGLAGMALGGRVSGRWTRRDPGRRNRRLLLLPAPEPPDHRPCLGLPRPGGRRRDPDPGARTERWDRGAAQAHVAAGVRDVVRGRRARPTRGWSRAVRIREVGSGPRRGVTLLGRQDVLRRAPNVLQQQVGSQWSVPVKSGLQQARVLRSDVPGAVRDDVGPSSIQRRVCTESFDEVDQASVGACPEERPVEALMRLDEGNVPIRPPVLRRHPAEHVVGRDPACFPLDGRVFHGAREHMRFDQAARFDEFHEVAQEDGGHHVAPVRHRLHEALVVESRECLADGAHARVIPRAEFGELESLAWDQMAAQNLVADLEADGLGAGGVSILGCHSLNLPLKGERWQSDQRR